MFNQRFVPETEVKCHARILWKTRFTFCTVAHSGRPEYQQKSEVHDMKYDIMYCTSAEMHRYFFLRIQKKNTYEKMGPPETAV